MLEPRTDDSFRLVIDLPNEQSHVIRPGGFQDGGRWFLSGEEKLTLIFMLLLSIFKGYVSSDTMGLLLLQGTSAEQDNRFLDKQKKLLKSMRFDDVLNKKVSQCMAV